MKKVVCLSVVQDVGKFGEHQNDQVSTQRLRAFSRGEYSESNESLSVSEDDVASSPNLKDMCQREVSLIGRSNWCRKECDILNLESVFLAKGHVMATDSKETIMDNIFGHDHVGLTILYCPGDISVEMIM